MKSITGSDVCFKELHLNFHTHYILLLLHKFIYESIGIVGWRKQGAAWNGEVVVLAYAAFLYQPFYTTYAGYYKYPVGDVCNYFIQQQFSERKSEVAEREAIHVAFYFLLFAAFVKSFLV